MDRTCLICHEPLVKKAQKKFCSPSCVNANNEARNPFISSTKKYGISTGAAGAVSEMQVAVALTQAGFFVFRGISPECPCDLIALRGNDLLRVEVRSGQKFANGTIHFPFGEKDYGRSEFVAVVDCDSNIFFIPSSLCKKRVCEDEKVNFGIEKLIKTQASA